MAQTFLQFLNCLARIPAGVVYMTVGKEVSVVQFDGSVIDRVLVAVENGYFFVCKREEWALAHREGREPICIGFRAEYLVEQSDTLRQ